MSEKMTAKKSFDFGTFWKKYGTLTILFLMVGFWRTLLILLLMAVGAFLGGVKDKKQFFLNIINRLFPPKNTIPYRERNPEIEKAIRESKEAEK